MERYAMYLRKSRADLALEEIQKFETLANHKTILTKLAKDKGIVISESDIYKEVVSGESIEERPEVQRLLRDVENEKFAGVFVFEVERLARGNTKDQGIMAEAFSYSNTLIITPQRTYDPNNEADEEYFEFGLFMSRREYKTIRRRMLAGKQIAVEKGQFLGSIPPYGWDKATIKKMHTLVPNADNPTMVLIYDMICDSDMTVGMIARKLTMMGIPSPKGIEWDSSSVHAIIKNPVNAGKIRWGYRKRIKKKVDGKTVKTLIRNPEPEIYDGIHEGTISWERYLYAQTRLASDPPLKNLHKLRNPLSGILVCPKCGKNIQLKQQNRNGMTYFRYAHPNKVLCKVKSMPMKDVHQVLIDGLKQHIENFEVILKNNDENKAIREHEEMVQAMSDKSDKLVAKRKQLFDYFEREIYTEAEFLERKNILNDEIAEHEKKLEELKKKVPQKTDYREKISSFNRIIELLDDDPTKNADELNILIKNFISKIEYDVEDLGQQKGGIISLDIFLK